MKSKKNRIKEREFDVIKREIFRESLLKCHEILVGRIKVERKYGILFNIRDFHLLRKSDNITKKTIPVVTFDNNAT